MKSENGMSLLRTVQLVIVLFFLLAVTTYVVLGPNGVLNKKEPVNSENISNVQNIVE